MLYVFELKIIPEGKFDFPFVPIEMKFDGEKYLLTKKYDSRDSAVKDVKDICNFLMQNINAPKDHYKNEFILCTKEFINRVDRIQDIKYQKAYVSIPIEYECSTLSLETRPHHITFDVFMDDEEYKLFKENGIHVASYQIKEAILELLKK